METFKFSLDRVRNFKGQVLDREKKFLGELQRRRNEIADRIFALEEYRDETILILRSKQEKGATMGELSSLGYLIDNARMQIKAALIELDEADEGIEKQREIVVEVYQEKTGMDKLEEKQEEEYRLLEAKSAEIEIMQVCSNRAADKGCQSDPISDIA